MNIKEYDYSGNNITFRLNNEIIMVNLTQMAKPFGKLTADFLRLNQTEKFINVLKRKIDMGIPITEIKQGGLLQGTWGHQKLALKFAAWLSPEFELWVYDRIEELLTQGYTKLDTISRKDLAQMLLDAETEKEKAISHAKAIEMHLQTQKPKIDFYDSVVESEGLLDLNDTAKLIGLGRNTMCSMLRSRGVFYKETKPYQRYMQLGYFKMKEYQYRNSVGEIGISTQTFVTQKGLSFLNRVLSHQTYN